MVIAPKIASYSERAICEIHKTEEHDNTEFQWVLEVGQERKFRRVPSRTR